MSDTVINGNIASYNGSLDANKMPDIWKVMQKLEPYQTPIMQYTFFSGKASQPCKNEDGKFSWFEKNWFPHYTTAIAAVTYSSGLTLTSANCANKDIFRLHDIVIIEDDTLQMGFVSSVTAGGGSDVVITHPDGTTALSSISKAGIVIKVTTKATIEENLNPTMKSLQEAELYNYCSIETTLVGTTGRQQSGSYYTNGKTQADLLTDEISAMKLRFERMFLLNLIGGRVAATGRNYTKGMLGFITTNRSYYSGALPEETLDAHFQAVFAKGTNHKTHFCGSTQLAKIAAIIKNKYGIVGGDVVVKKYGIDLIEYITPFGKVDIVWDPVLDGVFSDFGVTVDTKNIIGRYQDNDDKGSRKFRIERGVQTPGYDGKQDKLLADLGCQYMQESTAGWLIGGTSTLFGS